MALYEDTDLSEAEKDELFLGHQVTDIIRCMTQDGVPEADILARVQAHIAAFRKEHPSG